MPAGLPDVHALVEVAALKLLINGGEPLNGPVRNHNPESGGSRWQSQSPGQ